MSGRDPERDALLDEVAAGIRTFLAEASDGPVLGAAPGEVADLLRRFELATPGSWSDVTATLIEAGRLGATRQATGRYFGFVTGGLHPVAHGASLLAATWDQNAAVGTMSAVAAAAGEVSLTRLADLLGLPETVEGSFCAGAAVANLTAILVARNELLAAAGWDVAADGLFGAPAVRVLASAELHITARRALRLAGLGERRVEWLATDETGAVDVTQLPALDERPTLVLAQAGNVNTGHSDAFGRLRDWCQPAPQRWLHIDGAFGLWAAASTRRDLVAGAESADSWAVDTHKWLNTPYDGAVTYVARPGALARAMRATADYLPLDAEEAAPMHRGLQMSQAARAIPVWATLAALGRSGVADIIDRGCDQAERFAAGVVDAGAELRCPVVLNQVLVSFADDHGADVTGEVVERVQQGGEVWMGSTIWKDRPAMRVSFSDAAATAADVDRAIEAVVTAWRGIR